MGVSFKGKRRKKRHACVLGLEKVLGRCWEEELEPEVLQLSRRPQHLHWRNVPVNIRDVCGTTSLPVLTLRASFFLSPGRPPCLAFCRVCLFDPRRDSLSVRPLNTCWWCERSRSRREVADHSSNIQAVGHRLTGARPGAWGQKRAFYNSQLTIHQQACL